MKICVVMGTRPEIVKNHSIVHTLRRYSELVVLHTGQHFSPTMSDVVFDTCRYRPDKTMEDRYSLGRAIDWLSAEFAELRPDLVLVNGDTAAALAGAIAADYARIDVAHVEAGLRSYDAELIEERNRQMVDSIARYLFTYTAHEAEFLRARKELRGRVSHVGNTTVDFIQEHETRICEPLPSAERFIFATLHRRELLADRQRLLQALDGIDAVGRELGQVLFSLHPHTAKTIAEDGIDLSSRQHITVIEPVDPIMALRYLKHAAVLITDSGVMQEEAYLLGTPCVTVRDTTERQLTITHGANELAGFSASGILEASIRQSKRKPLLLPAIYGEPGCALRIAEILLGRVDGLRDSGSEFPRWATSSS
jgi:UDP-N-acetylglucosamine 2-epimerase (non-hydrolysing)